VKERKVLENKETEGPSSSASTVVAIKRRGLDPWTLYLYAMKSPATKEKYLMRLGKFLDFLNIQEGGTREDKARVFAEKGRDDNIWAFNSILSFIQLLKERVDRKEITAGTIRNYVRVSNYSVRWQTSLYHGIKLLEVSQGEEDMLMIELQH
jgi:hypothetical protein